jgi:hypothetical protein
MSLLEALKALREELEQRERFMGNDDNWKENAMSITVTWNRQGKMHVSSKNTEGVGTLEVIGALDMARFTILDGAN